jgi:hypothetical protein
VGLGLDEGQMNRAIDSIVFPGSDDYTAEELAAQSGPLSRRNRGYQHGRMVVTAVVAARRDCVENAGELRAAVSRLGPVTPS